MTRAEKLSNLIVSIVAAAAFALPTVALSQDTTTTPPATTSSTEPEKKDGDTTELESITVTGSILRRTDTETPAPVTTITSEMLEQRGINTVAEAIQRLPANNAGTLQQGWNTGFNFASGATAPSLRGLTVQATLSIADGLRMAPYPLADDGHRNFVDLNTIPSSIVDKIEILRDGASSTYGADAIAGVVNVITKKEIKGFHVGAATGFSQDGGGGEKRLDAAWGMGDLSSQGYNFYIGGEYQGNDVLWARDRSHPFNTADWSDICGPSGSCMANLNWNGYTPESDFYFGNISVPGVTLVRPVAVGQNAGGTVNGASSDQFEYLNDNGGDPCRQWPSYDQADFPGATGFGASAPDTICEVNFQSAYQMLQPDSERMGLSMRFTADVMDGSQFYVMGNFYKNDTVAEFTPLGFNGTPTPPRPAGVAAYNVLLPIYVCPTGIGTLSGENTGCDAGNGILNPYNPYAAGGEKAQAFLRSPYGRTVETQARSLRGAVGLEGTFGDGWGYSANLTASDFTLNRIQANYLIPQRIMNVVAQGTFNFSDPTATSQEVWDYIAPENFSHSTSRLWQAQGIVSRDLVQLAGGPLQAAVGVSLRKESLDNPSANPGDDFSQPGDQSAQYARYYSINAVGAKGSRDVRSGFFEINAPAIEDLELMLSGRFDDYSSGQTNFSPKMGFKYRPIDEAAVRGTWSEGFRIPSFNEAFGLPTTGYVTAQVDCDPLVTGTYCADHGNNAYATGPYSIGLTSIGNPALDPEESTSFTLGLVFEPIDRLGLTVDYWNIEIDGLIRAATASNSLINDYYLSGGNPTLPDGVTVVPGTPDPAFPNELPQLGFIVSSFTNTDKQEASGLDFGANYSLRFADTLTWRTAFEASYLMSFEQTEVGGATYEYAGFLSPCDVTSCSGAPEWRATWQNTLETAPTQFGKTAVSLTAYYTDGYSAVTPEYVGTGDTDCASGLHASVATYEDNTPVNCTQDAQWNFDLTVRQTLDKYQVFLDVLNVFDIEPEFDPSAAYGLFGFNPAWGGPNVMGRFFRLGVKVDFE